MASVTKSDDATNLSAPDKPQPSPQLGKGGGGPGKNFPSRENDGGFFHIRKSGQGYWTRMGTAGVSALLIVLISYNLYDILKGEFRIPANVASGIGLATGLGLVLLSWYWMNKPTSVDFLVSTDSEMKKVNWTSKSDLIGSTKVVIFFMFFIAILLLLIDVIFGYFFQFITVLKTGPFG